MTALRARVASDAVHLLAEGPVWDAHRERVLWVDITAGDVCAGTLCDGVVEPTRRWHVDQSVGAVVPAADGRLLVAGHTSLAVLEPDGTLTPGPAVLPVGVSRRLNDGACDPAGRFVVGSLTTPLGRPTGHETLTRVEVDGTLTTLDDDLALSNGIAWSPDGALLYSVDTLAHVVRVRDYDAASGTCGERRVHLRFDDGLPDGLACDADGNLWVAVWGRGEVRCLSPDGRVLHTVDVDAPHTSSVAFVGPDLDTLLITTASAELDAVQHAASPDSGRLFTLPVGELVGVRGLATTPWDGRPGNPVVEQEI